jgi:hypothetical protein
MSTTYTTDGQRTVIQDKGVTQTIGDGFSTASTPLRNTTVSANPIV